MDTKTLYRPKKLTLTVKWSRNEPFIYKRATALATFGQKEGVCTCQVKREGGGKGSFIPELPCSREKVEMRERKQRNVKERKKGRERERIGLAWSEKVG
jgi:hypothetical protein